MSQMNSRWRKGAQRYSGDRTIESSTWQKEPGGGRRRVTKAVSEILFVERSHEAYGWRHGAKVRVT